MTLSDRTPPQDMEAEQAVLGAMMQGDKEAIEDVREILRPSDFYRPAHEQIYRAITDLHDQSNPVDAVTVTHELGKRGEIAKVGGAPYLHTLLASVLISANAGFHAEIVREKAALRRALETFTRGAQGVYEGQESEVILDRAAAELAGIPLRTSKGRMWSEILPRVIDGLDSTTPPGMALPWPEMDRVVHGLRPGNVYMFAARPKVGKSLVAQAIATETVSRHGKAALFFTYEMSDEELGVRIVADKASIPLDHLITHNLNDFETVKLAEMYRETADWPLEVHDNPDMTVAQINAIVREASRRLDLGVVLIDYLGLLKAVDDKISREQQVSAMSRAIKVMSKLYKVPVVVLVQLNRGPESRPDKRPLASDMRDSGAQEQDATAVVLLWRPEDEPGVLRADVALNRFGPQATVDLEFWGHYARIASPELEQQKRRAVA